MTPEEEFARNRPPGPYAHCRGCGKDIVCLSSGVWRSTETDPAVDRIACGAQGQKVHKPEAQQ
ncbi:hypothetical protein [Nonomuraea lactucae]|uniref:hypothetical protein n=1 Tax=Nonomuraea lactucae TaxID=2249762 RepID=UPI000DE4CC55|nr:hypothetical protein [Nonomuraea lactucae]